MGKTEGFCPTPATSSRPSFLGSRPLYPQDEGHRNPLGDSDSKTAGQLPTPGKLRCLSGCWPVFWKIPLPPAACLWHHCGHFRGVTLSCKADDSWGTSTFQRGECRRGGDVRCPGSDRRGGAWAEGAPHGGLRRDVTAPNSDLQRAPRPPGCVRDRCLHARQLRYA